MRELLLVRKLQEENAKKNKPIENIYSKNSETPIKGHNDTADSSTNNITKNTTDNTNQTFNREVQELENIKYHDIDDNSKGLTPDDKINLTHQLNTSNVDKISEQVRSELTFTSDNYCNQSMNETSINEKTENNQNLQSVEVNVPVNSVHDGKDLIDSMSEEERKHNEAISLALQTKRESLKEFFLQKQPYIHKDTFTDNQIVLDSDDKKSASLTSNIKDKSIKEELKNPSQEDTTSTDKPITSPRADLELSPDEKRQKAAATRNMQRKNLKNFLKQKKLEVKESLKTENVENDINSEENFKLNGLNGDDKIESETKSKGEINNSIHLKRSKNKTSSADDSDGSVDLDALIAGGSDLESGEIQLNDDGLDDGDDDFWKIDPAELERHLTPSTSPLRRQSPDPHSIPTLNSLVNITRPVSMIAEEDENLSDTPLEVDGQEADDIMNSFSNTNGFDMGSKEDDEINEIDMSLDTQITPILKPVSPSPVPSPYPTLSGGKPGIPAGLSKTAFSAHFGPSPLSPTSSRASSVGDPDEYETMSNGSVRSAGSAKSGVSGMRRPSTITGLRSPSRVGSHIGSPSRIAAPGRADSHSSTPTPQRSRSLSVVSDSSTEESTTSSVGATSPSRIASPTRGLHMSMYNMTQSISGGTRPRRVSNSSTDDALTRSSASHIASPRVRPSSRAGSNIGTQKSSNISTGSQSRIRSSVPPSNVNSTKSKYGMSQLHASTSNPELEKRPSSRAGIAKPSSTPTTSVRSLSRLGSLSEPSKLKKPRPQSIAVGNTSTAKIAQSNNISPSSVLRASHYGGRRSTDSLSSHDEYSASSMIFTPPESPTNASETDSLTSLTSSVSYGSSPGRGTSPIPSHNTSIPTRLSKPGTRTSITAVSSVNKSPASRMVPSKLATPSGQAVSGLRKPRVTKE